MIRVIVGLGNPGPEYANTRHNLGYRVADELARRWGWSFRVHKSKAMVATGIRHEQSIAMMKPTTYMNESGRAICAMANFVHCQPDNILVIYDDLDSSFGRLRMRAFGGAGGHNGLKSIIQYLGVNTFPRLKIGIGRPQHGDPAEYVLRPFHRDEQQAVTEMIAKAADATELTLSEGLTSAMNAYSG